jgi:hypothetical protein
MCWTRDADEARPRSSGQRAPLAPPSRTSQHEPKDNAWERPSPRPARGFAASWALALGPGVDFNILITRMFVRPRPHQFTLAIYRGMDRLGTILGSHFLFASACAMAPWVMTDMSDPANPNPNACLALFAEQRQRQRQRLASPTCTSGRASGNCRPGQHACHAPPADLISHCTRCFLSTWTSQILPAAPR